MSDQEEPKSENFIVERIEEVAALKKQYNAEQIKFVKNLINPDLTDNELFLFMNYASSIKLNPMNGEILPVVYSGQNGRRVNTITTRNGKRVIASRTGELDSIVTNPIYIAQVDIIADGQPTGNKEVTRVEPWQGGTLWGAVSTVIRKGKEFKATVPFKEYNTGKNVWASKPETMIKKVAESQALTMAFPEILGGLYDEVEVMEQPEERESKIAGTIEGALKERKAKKIEPIIEDEPATTDENMHMDSEEPPEEEITPHVQSPEEAKAEAEKIAEEKKAEEEKQKTELQERIDRAKNYSRSDDSQLPLGGEVITADN